MSQDKHPAPWQVDESVRPIRFISDADGNEIAADLSGSPLVRELIRLAPDMEKALRKVECRGTLSDNLGSGDRCCPDCEGEPSWTKGGGYGAVVHDSDCAIGTILAALDAARKAADTV